MGNQAEINGFCSAEHQSLRDAFAQNFAEGHEVGASLCMTLNGETIIDVWGGYRDLAKTKPWREDTIVCLFSATKIPTTVCALICIDRGLLDLDKPIATYWPEFAQHGKGDTTVRHALTHRANVPGFREPISAEQFADWNLVIERIAAEKPWFENHPVCYHAYTYGHILGELVQRVTGASLRDFLHEELTGPLGADILLGLQHRADLDRLADFVNTKPLPHVDVGERVFKATTLPIEDPRWTSDWNLVSMVNPGGGGFSNARGMCRLATMLAMEGAVEGKRYLSAEIVREAAREQVYDTCPMLGPIRLGLGFGLDGSEFPAPTPDAFHWGGYGGAWCFMDAKRHLAGAYIMNNCMVPESWGTFVDPRMHRLFDLIRSEFP